MNFINKINKYLLENYPLIWNTRLVWMIGINILIHLIFFIIGYSTVNNIEDLKEQYKLNQFFYDTSAVYYNFLISIFMLLIWIVFYLRNNAFKNLYVVKKGMLFKQFCIILVIFFISISQFYSFKQGLITKVKSLYNWQEVDKDIKTFNKTALFLVQNQLNYEIDKKKYPAPFPLNVSITNKNLNIENVDTSKAYIKHKGAYYQFYKIDKNEKENDNYAVEEIYYDVQEFNDEIKNRNVINVNKFKELLHPSLFNYSKQLFYPGQDSLAYRSQLNHHQKILEKANDSEIKNELKAFISLANKYKIEHNLKVESWFKLINNKPNYLLSELINTSNPIVINSNDYNYTKNNNSRFNTNIPYSKTLYLSLDNTDSFFNNVHESYFSKFDSGFFYFLIVLSFVLAILLFLFKTTDIKTILLSIVASLVVLVIIVWLMSSFRGVFESNQNREYFIMIFISFIIILLSFSTYILKWKKVIISTIWSLGLFATPTFFIFIILYYIEHLKQVYRAIHPKVYNYKSDFEIWFENYGFWLIILIWIFTVYFYSVFIRKLKARPE